MARPHPQRIEIVGKHCIQLTIIRGRSTYGSSTRQHGACYEHAGDRTRRHHGLVRKRSQGGLETF